MGPSLKWATVNEPALLGHSASGEQSGGHQAEWGKRQIPTFSQDPPAYLVLASSWARVSGNRLGSVFFGAPEPLPSLPTGWVQALRQQWTLPPSLFLQPHGSSHLYRVQFACRGGASAHLSLLCVWPEEPEGSWVLGAQLPQRWQLGRVWDLVLREPPAEICSSARVWTSEGNRRAYGTFLSECRITLAW